MALKSVYQPHPSLHGGIIHISDEEHRHLVVARAEPGEWIEVFDGQGHVWKASVVEVGKRQTSARIETEDVVPRPSLELILGQALIRNAAFELALEKAVEVGVTRVIPFAAERSNVSANQKLDRWLRIVVEAAKQSKRFHLPTLDRPKTFDEVLNVPAASRILFAEREGASIKSALLGSPVLFLVGPEGGWTENEIKSARDAGFREVTLGSGILRSETAAIVGAALIRHEIENPS